MPALPPPTVRLSDPGEIAASLPHLIGFRPHESLVVVSLRGSTTRTTTLTFGLTARVDLPSPQLRPRLLPELVRSVASDRPSAVLVAVVSEHPDVLAPAVHRGEPEAADLPELPHRDLVRDAVLAFGRSGLPVLTTLLVRGGRWWSYECPDACCAPGAGTLLPAGTSELAAASAVTGQVVEADRGALARRIAPVGPLAAAGMAQACDEVGADLAVRSVVDGWEGLVTESTALLEAAVRRLADAGAQRLPDAEVARLAWGLREWQVRDRALALAVGPDAAAAETLWTELTRRAPAPLDAAPATLLAVTAWVRGDGALANVALERALDSEPGYSLAGMLRAALDRCVPPAEIRQLVLEAAGVEGSAGAGRPG